MATKQIILQIYKPKKTVKFKLSYKDDAFLKAELISGKFDDAEWKGLGYIIPQYYKDIKSIEKKFVSLTFKPLLKDKTLYTLCLEEYFDFYWNKNKINYKMSAIGGASLKHILKYLQSICSDDAEVFATWKVVLSNWDKLDSFYQNQQDLQQINRNFNTILTQIKNGKSTTKTTAKSFSESARANL